MITKEILVKVEYHGQVWYEVKTITMGTTHGQPSKGEEGFIGIESINTDETSIQRQP